MWAGHLGNVRAGRRRDEVRELLLAGNIATATARERYPCCYHDQHHAYDSGNDQISIGICFLLLNAAPTAAPHIGL
jgi:hypothetical protein